jgi:hypothetical protein
MALHLNRFDAVFRTAKVPLELFAGGKEDSIGASELSSA